MEKREGSHRSQRLTIGGLSAPLALVLSFFYDQHFGQEMPDQVSIAIATLIGSLVSVGALCLEDLRCLILAYFRHRRYTDKRR